MAWFRNAKDKMSDAKDKVNDQIDDLLEDDDDVKILDQSDKDFLRRIFGDLSSSAVSKQIAVGAIVGGCTGVLFRRVGLIAAIALGCSFLILQIAHNQQWVTVNWGRVDNRVKRVKRQLRRVDRHGWKRAANSIEIFIRENMFIASGFLGGFLIGLAV